MQLAPVTLADAHVRLVPFDPAEHAASLRVMAEGSIEELATWPYRGPGDWVGNWLANIENRSAAGTLISFAVLEPQDNRFVGVTAYITPDPAARAVEIGMTCYAPAVHGTAINPGAKRLLLGHAFGQGANRVQFNIDERNKRSQAAVRKLGATQEGLLRENRVLPDGFVRSTVVFSILASEWPSIKARLDARLAALA